MHYWPGNCLNSLHQQRWHLRSLHTEEWCGYHLIGLDTEFQLGISYKWTIIKLLESEDRVPKALSITYKLFEKEKIISNSFSAY